MDFRFWAHVLQAMSCNSGNIYVETIAIQSNQYIVGIHTELGMPCNSGENKEVMSCH